MNVYEIGSMEEKLSSNTYPGRGFFYFCFEFLKYVAHGKKFVS